MTGGVNTASHWNAADYAKNAAFVPAMGMPVVELLAPQPGERILDIGCGDGALTEALVAARARVFGIDASPEMIAAARARGLDVAVADAQTLDVAPEYDAAFSNAALHWMLDKAAVARGVFAALRPGGRFVGEMGGEGNVATIWRAVRAELAARGRVSRPQDTHWYPSVADFTAVYAAASFVDIEARLIPRPTPLPTGVAGWVRTFRTGLMDAGGIPEADVALMADWWAVMPALRAALFRPGERQKSFTAAVPTTSY